jgi:hypothetical protein
LKLLIRFEVSLAPEPVLHGGLKPLERHAQAGFQQAIGDGQSVIENRVVGEIAHGEVVDPVKGTGLTLTRCVNSLDQKPADKHAFTLSDGPAGELLDFCTSRWKQSPK